MPVAPFIIGARRVRGILRTTTGATYTSDGVISLGGRDYKGALTEWA
jgi:hypothetical protein